MADSVDGCIYIVDDDDAVRDSVRILLEALGYDVRVFASGPEFLASFDGRHGACLILDINMPDMDGLEVLDAVDTGWPGLPVIMITGRGDGASKVQALRNGAIVLLEKPFGDVALVRSIERALAGRIR